MSETPEQRVARLERELAEAKVVALHKELAEARGESTAQFPTGQFRHYDGSWPGARVADAAQPDQRLAPAPRTVPTRFRLVLFPFSFWALFVLFMVTVVVLLGWTAAMIWFFADQAASIHGLVRK